MLEQLKIQNLVLVDELVVDFKMGFNVLSGETGAGKSALMGALNLVLGGRCDVGLIRRGCSRALVEAKFIDWDNALVRSAMNAASVIISKDEPLTLRREISTTGRSRAFLNDHSLGLSSLREIAILLVDMLGQTDNQLLRSAGYHLKVLDAYAGLEPDVKAFRQTWQKEKFAREELALLEAGIEHRNLQRERLEGQIQEIQEANVQEGEEEELFAEYSRLSNAEQLERGLYLLDQEVSSSGKALLSRMQGLKANFQTVCELDPGLEDLSSAYREALLSLEELAYALRTRQGKIIASPDRLEELNERLALINRLKRMYGKTIEDIRASEAALGERIATLDEADEQMELLRETIPDLKQESDALAEKLTKKRIESSKPLKDVLERELRLLNMPKLRFEIEITDGERNDKGDDHIEFLVAPNPGENYVKVSESVSGGELARIMLALKVVLAEKEELACLVFDEIDANIGGETASIVGRKLREIGEKRQLLCITHFAQVAMQGHHHIQISKKECDGRTVTSIATLNEIERESELIRMIGGETSASSLVSH